jgi:hypothetical protein
VQGPLLHQLLLHQLLRLHQLVQRLVLWCRQVPPALPAPPNRRLQ